MTTLDERRSPTVQRLLRGSAGIAVAMGVMNVATYGFQMVAARLLGPEAYGAIAGLMALLMVVAVLQLGLQATAARRISATPDHVAQIEDVIMGVTYRWAFGLGLVLLLASPAVWLLLRLDSIVPAILLAVAAVPLTVMGGQAGILQGERRWLPLAVVYLGVGLPRLLLGTLCILVSPTETGAMVGVLLGLMVPAATGWYALRRGREAGDTSTDHELKPIAKETVRNSVALLAFFVLSNADIVVARNVLDGHDAGLYAGGLILTKAVLFLPQFVVIVAFPSMAGAGDRRRALVHSLGAVLAAGILCTMAAAALSGVALVFIGGPQYAEVQPRLWAFSVLGTLLAMLQLLVYSVLARQGTRATYLVWGAVLVLLAGSFAISTLTGLLGTIIVIDAVLFVVLLGLSLWHLRPPRLADRPEPAAAA